MSKIIEINAHSKDENGTITSQETFGVDLDIDTQLVGDEGTEIVITFGLDGRVEFVGGRPKGKQSPSA